MDGYSNVGKNKQGKFTSNAGFVERANDKQNAQGSMAAKSTGSLGGRYNPNYTKNGSSSVTGRMAEEVSKAGNQVVGKEHRKRQRESRIAHGLAGG
ncbi:MAG: hypothetical protein HUJ96_10220 [Marinilabiliaceae bacterium]|nr:hypothetical protein [Marinilabiliaceae bacterium]